MKKIKIGKVIKPSNANPWPHEERLADILSKAGHTVEFIPEHTISGSPDVYIDGVRYEMKSPISDKPNTWEKRLKEAIRAQSNNIIFDTSRIKNKPDYEVFTWLRKKYKEQPQIKKLIVIDKKGKITIDFKR